MQDPGPQPASRDSVRRYLLTAFLVDEATVDEAMKAESVTPLIEDAQRYGSYAYYVGDKIASANEWESNPEYDETEFEDDDDE